MRWRRFPHPETKPRGPQTWPVFLPFAGCPHRCVFCGQDRQTGQGVRPLEQMHAALQRDLEQEEQRRPRRSLELALFGGTFTALPAPWPERFLELAARHRATGLIRRVRCSTRPDAVAPDRLAALRDMGLDVVELGIQSFNDRALLASGRGYTAAQALQGCRNVREAGLDLGVQLMPGLPGDLPGIFQNDVEQTVRLAPQGVRLYPCVVIDKTPLAQTWQKGGYRPWSLTRTRQELALALGALFRACIPILRVGLHPEPALLDALLDGPWHPALGQMVRSLALFDHVRTMALPLGDGPKLLRYPQRFSGEIMGHRAELRRCWQRAGVTLRSWRGRDFIVFHP